MKYMYKNRETFELGIQLFKVVFFFHYGNRPFNFVWVQVIWIQSMYVLFIGLSFIERPYLVLDLNLILKVACKLLIYTCKLAVYSCEL